MNGREPRQENDLFFVCSLIEYIGRKTRNRRCDIVNALGMAEIEHFLELADVYHCENMDKLLDELVDKHHIKTGNFDNIAACRYAVPSHFDIGKVYKRLIIAVSREEKITFAKALIKVYNSWISMKIDDYNSSMFFENPDYLSQSFLFGAPWPE